MTEDQYAEIKAKLAANDTEHSSFKRRLDEHDDALKEQNKIFVALEKQNSNIERLTDSMNRMGKNMENVDKRLDAIEKEPADKWKKITFEIIKYVVIALVGLAVGYIIKDLGK